MAKWEYTDKPMHSEHRRADSRYVDKDLATQCLHAGERWEQQYFWTSSTPIHNSTTYFYDSAQDLDDRVYYRKPGYVYSRGGSPTNTTLERALSTLEGAEVTHVCSSGMAASHLALLTAGAGCVFQLGLSPAGLCRGTAPHAQALSRPQRAVGGGRTARQG